MQSRRFATVVVLVIVVAFVVVAVAPAFAATPGSLALHARLLAATPKDGATVTTAAEVVLAFNEDVDPTFVKVSVQGPDGPETAGTPAVDGSRVRQALSADLPAGTHVVTYRVVSTDGHPVSGTVTFTTTKAPAPGSPSATPSPTPTASLSSPPVASPEPTVTSAPTSGGSGGGATPWLVVLGAVVLAALGLGAAWRTIGGPPQDAAADADPDADPEPTERGGTRPPAP